MEQIIFASLATSSASFRKIGLLLDSLKSFGGGFYQAPLLIVHPDNLDVTSENAVLLKSHDIEAVPFHVGSPEKDFPLANVAIGAAAAEQAVAGTAENLVWLLEDTIILDSPSDFVLPTGRQHAYRPVHHTKIGSPWQAPPGGFWSAIYRHCKVEPDRLFPMVTCIRDNTIRPYFNAGCQVVRPENGLFSQWCEAFLNLYRHSDFAPFFVNDPLYRVFMHQAVLAGVVLRNFRSEQLHELPESYNYPLHLHADYPHEFRPAKLNGLVTCRYENFDELRQVLAVIPVDEPLKTWLQSRT